MNNDGATAVLQVHLGVCEEGESIRLEVRVDLNPINVLVGAGCIGCPGIHTVIMSDLRDAEVCIQ